MPSFDDPLCFSSSGVTTWGQFAADVGLLRGQIAAATHICNLMADRYDFMVGLAAAMLNDQVTVLPAATAPKAVQAALDGSQRPLILGGEPGRYGGFDTGPRITRSGRGIDPGELASGLASTDAEVHVFTSGSTKIPERQVKDWKALVGGASVSAEILRRHDLDPGEAAIFGTTSHQHMYGLEAAIFLGLGFGHCIHATPVFFPADIEVAVATARACGLEKAVLLTSPTHLKFLEPTLLQSPDIQVVVSATAPLALAQAERLEARGDLAVMEIYGSTETGALAIRRTIEGNVWEPLAGFRLCETPDGVVASAPHLSETVNLADEIEPLPDGRFRLLGRKGDMVSIAGKRANLSALNAILLETPGLRDGVVLRQQTEEGDQLAVVAVLANDRGLSETDGKSAIRKQFYAHVDGIFAPRRIFFVEALPRTPTGKITAESLSQLLRLTNIGA